MFIVEAISSIGDIYENTELSDEEYVDVVTCLVDYLAGRDKVTAFMRFLLRANKENRYDEVMEKILNISGLEDDSIQAALRVVCARNIANSNVIDNVRVYVLIALTALERYKSYHIDWMISVSKDEPDDGLEMSIGNAVILNLRICKSYKKQ